MTIHLAQFITVYLAIGFLFISDFSISHLRIYWESPPFFFHKMVVVILWPLILLGIFLGD